MSQKPPFDYLLQALVYLSAHYGRAKSAEALRAGLAVDAAGMKPQAFLQAAARIGLRTKVADKKITAIDPATFPAVLVLKTGGIVILLSKHQNMLKIFDLKQQKEIEVPFEQVAKTYSGKVILTHPYTEVARPERDRHWFWGAFWQNTGVYRDVVIAAILINLFGLASPLFIMTVYDRVVPNQVPETGWVLGIGALIVFVFDFIVRTLRGYFIDFAGRRIDVSATRRVYDQVLDMKLSERPKSSGAFANTLKDFDTVRDFMTSATVTGLVDLPFTLFFLFIIFMIGEPIAFLLIGLIGLIFVAGLLLQIPLKHFVRQSMKSAEAKHGLLVETIHGLETIKAIGADGGFRARYGAQVGENAMWGQKSRFYSAISGNFAGWVQQSASILVVLMGMYMVWDPDRHFSMGALIACVILTGRAMAPVGQMANLITRYHQTKSAMRSIDALMAKPVDRPANINFLHRPVLKGKIAFDRVDFAYPKTDRKVLDAVSFSIQPGEKVGLIGRIGSGKSTIARLILDLYDPTEGTILFDDTDE
ncbi:MAG: ATP-binding cassette domain-containing protein, partial [Rhodospirillales bacterium]|nr:ATP-binding cassette domain-containing protein [Rhodospirillales bacterium]